MLSSSSGAHARRQLEQKDLFIQLVAETHRPGGAGRLDVADQPVPLHLGQVGEIDRRKGVVADGLVLFGAGARDDRPAEHHHHPAAAGVQGADDAVPQVLFGVGDLVRDGLLGAGQDDGLVRVLHQIAQGRRRIGQGVGAVAEDKAVVAAVVFLDGAGHVQPVGRAHVGAVDAAQGQGVRLAQAGQARHMGQQFPAGQDRPQALGRAYAGDGAAGGDKEDLFLVHSCLP